MESTQVTGFQSLTSPLLGAVIQAVRDFRLNNLSIITTSHRSITALVDYLLGCIPPDVKEGLSRLYNTDVGLDKLDKSFLSLERRN